MERLIRFMNDDDGLESVEYAVTGALIIIAIIASVTALGGGIALTFGRVVTAIGG